MTHHLSRTSITVKHIKHTQIGARMNANGNFRHDSRTTWHKHDEHTNWPITFGCIRAAKGDEDQSQLNRFVTNK